MVHCFVHAAFDVFRKIGGSYRNIIHNSDVGPNPGYFRDPVKNEKKMKKMNLESRLV